jgi:serine/threonine protein kinase
MLNRRGGESDVVKVLDFGLVKAIDEAKQAGQTAANSLTGTPLYMAPESFQTPNAVDARSDLYALGAVGYFLLTGRPVFEASHLVDLIQQQVDSIPIAPSQRLGRPVSRELEAALLSCLDKQRARRPQTARELSVLLSKVPEAGRWTLDDADDWWTRHERGMTGSAAKTGDGAAKIASYHDRTIVGPQSEDLD